MLQLVYILLNILHKEPIQQHIKHRQYMVVTMSGFTKVRQSSHTMCLYMVVTSLGISQCHPRFSWRYNYQSSLTTHHTVCSAVIPGMYPDQGCQRLSCVHQCHYTSYSMCCSHTWYALSLVFVSDWAVI